MKTKSFPSLNADLSLLGYGLMRLPEKDGKIDFEQAHKLTDKAIENGVNYFDTAYMYHNGESELFLNDVIKRHGRSSFYIADKLPLWDCNDKEYIDKTIEEQFRRLDVDYIDFYLLHGMGKDNWEKALKYDAIPTLEKLKKDGRIGRIGFSFHDNKQVLESMMQYEKWDFAYIQFNYFDYKRQKANELYQVLEKHNIPMVAMEPVRGGLLANPPRGFGDEFKKQYPDRSVASWALRYSGSFTNTCNVLSGMSNMEQVEDNLNIFNNFKPLNTEELALVKSVRNKIFDVDQIPCTNCAYCKSCPLDIDIQRCFGVYNEYKIMGNEDWYNGQKKEIKESGRGPEKCTACGMCVAKCPQKIEIPSRIKELIAE